MRTTFSYTSASAWWIAAVMLAGAPASGQTRQWLSQFGSFSYDGINALAPGTGGVYVGGETLGSLFGTSAGGFDAFLAWYTEGGVRAWGVQFGTGASDRLYGLRLVGAGPDVFLCGETKGSLGGPNAGGNDAWLARYDPSGSRVWAQQLGSGGEDDAHVLTSDGLGGLFVAGSTSGLLAAPAPGGWDGWVARYDGAGNQMWLRQVGTSGAEFIRAAAEDGAGGVYVAGSTDGSFGAPSAGFVDTWIARFDGAGSRLWVKQVGTPAIDNVRGLGADGSGGIFVVGLTGGALGGPPVGDWDVWVARFDAQGNQTAITQFGTSGSDLAEGIASDGRGGIFIGGSTSGSLGGPQAGLADIWLARLSPALKVTWMQQFGTPHFETTMDLAPAGAGGFYAAGYTRGNLTGPNMGQHDGDAWVTRYTWCYPDCNGDGALNLADWGCFQNRFALQDTYADCNGDGQLNLADFGCFQTKFALGCP